MADLSAFPITQKWPVEDPTRLQLFSYPTPNGIKVSCMLEETGLPYEAHRVTPGSRLLIFDGVAHYPHCEAPEKFVDALIDFVDTTEPARLPARSTPARVRGPVEIRPTEG